jgi:large subunit ribosomal protein L18e
MKNSLLHQLIVDLDKSSKKEKAPIWKRVASELSAPKQNMREVNVTKLAKNTAKGDTVIVPGKVLGTGTIAHAISVVAYSWSDSAAAKITAAGGSIRSINDELSKNGKGSNLRIIG